MKGKVFNEISLRDKTRGDCFELTRLFLIDVLDMISSTSQSKRLTSRVFWHSTLIQFPCTICADLPFSFVISARTN